MECPFFFIYFSGILRGVEVDGKRKTNWNIYPMEFKPNFFEKYVFIEAFFYYSTLGFVGLRQIWVMLAWEVGSYF